jgi:hypothetical protein
MPGRRVLYPAIIAAMLTIAGAQALAFDEIPTGRVNGCGRRAWASNGTRPSLQAVARRRR